VRHAGATHVPLAAGCDTSVQLSIRPQRHPIVSLLDDAKTATHNLGRSVPTVHREGPYRFYFTSHDAPEPPHVHVDRGNATAKLWLQPVSVARSIGFSDRELNDIAEVVRSHADTFTARWREFFRTWSR
jgi:hypothetical protein